jgi:hypothetical protein
VRRGAKRDAVHRASAATQSSSRENSVKLILSELIPLYAIYEFMT